MPCLESLLRQARSGVGSAHLRPLWVIARAALKVVLRCASCGPTRLSRLRDTSEVRPPLTAPQTPSAPRSACRPLLRWAGSKRQSLEQLACFWSPEYERYVEPFAGSSSLFFRLAPPRALLADKNAALIETYRVLRTRPKQLYDTVSDLPVNRQTYNGIRGLNPTALSPLGRAARFVYLNRYCFNGIYRTDKDGRFNVPFSPRRTGALPANHEFTACARLLQRAELRAWDFGTTLRFVGRRDFVYLDPPYAVGSRRVFREYGPKHFTTGDLVRLAGHLDRIHRRGAVFVLTYADCAEVRAIAAQWSSLRLRVRRHIAGFAAARRHAYEVLVTNGPIPWST